MKYKYHKTERFVMHTGLNKMYERGLITSGTLHDFAAKVNAPDPFGQGEEVEQVPEGYREFIANLRHMLRTGDMDNA